jgi:hypothetical protein
MLRFIIKHSWNDNVCGSYGEEYMTVDDDNKTVERLLTSGGKGESGFDRCELLGVTVIEDIHNAS